MPDLTPDLFIGAWADYRGFYLWSNPANWSRGLPVDGDSVTLDRVPGGLVYDDIPDLELAALATNETYLLVGGKLHADLYDPYDDTINLEGNLDGTPAGAGASFTVDGWSGPGPGADSYILADRGTTVYLNAAPPTYGQLRVPPSSVTFAASDGTVVLGPDFSGEARGRTFVVGQGGALAARIPELKAEVDLATGGGNQGGGSLEVAGTAVRGVDILPGAVAIDTDAGTTRFDDVSWSGGTATSWTASLDRATGLQRVTFYATPPTAAPITVQATTTERVGYGTERLIGDVSDALFPNSVSLATTAPGRGSLRLDGDLLYYDAPATGGTDRIGYAIDDEYGRSYQGEFSTLVDGGPTVAPGRITLGHGQLAQLGGIVGASVAPGLAGDTETILSPEAARGRLVANGDAIAYTAPDAGTDVVSYGVQDQLGDYAVGSIAVTIDPGPRTAALSAMAQPGGRLDLTDAILAAAKPGLGGDTLFLVSGAGATAGQAALVDGRLIYTAPDAPSAGPAADRVGYTLSDQYGDLASGSVAIAIAAPDPAPSGPVLSEPVLSGPVLFGPRTGGGAIHGSAGPDVIQAYGPDNVVDGGGGADAINAGNGNARVNLGGGGATVVLGGSDNAVGADGSNGGANGDDDVSGGVDGNRVVLGDGRDTVSLTGRGNFIQLGDGPDKVVGGSGVATIRLGDGNDAVTASGDDNAISAGDGRDAVSGLADDNTVLLGDGDDQVSFAGSGNVVRAGNGANLVLGGADNNAVAAGDGNDTVLLRGFHNRIVLGDGHDKVVAGAGAETIEVGDGDDAIGAGGNDNQITAGNGDDDIDLRGLDNRVVLGNGHDQLAGGFCDMIDATGTDLLLLGGQAETVTLRGEGSYLDDLSSGTIIRVGSVRGTATIADLARDPGFVLDLTGAANGPLSMAEVSADLRDDGHGGSILSLGAASGGTAIDLPGVSPALLAAGHVRFG